MLSHSSDYSSDEECEKVVYRKTVDTSKPSTSKQALLESVTPNSVTTKPEPSKSNSKQPNIKYSKTFMTVDKKLFNFAHDLYNKFNFVHGTCTVAWNLDTQKKQASNMPSNKQRETSQGWRSGHNMAYVMAKESGLTVIDIDDAKKCKQLTRLCCQYCKYTVKTKKGFHFYFQRCDELGIKLESQDLGFDLPALLYAPPGFYENDAEKIEYKFTVANCYGTEGLFGTTSRDLNDEEELEVVEMPQEIIDEIKRLLAEKNKGKSKPKKTEYASSSKTETRAVSTPVHTNTPFQKYRELLLLIQDRNQDYEDWRNVGFALHQVSDSDDMYQVFTEWSQVDYPNYDDTATQNLWQHCKDNQENGITFGTLVHWAKEADPVGYKQWNNKWGLGKLKYLVNNFNQTEAAKYFHSLKPNDFLYNNKQWYMIKLNNVWTSSAEKFINIIYDTLKDEFHKLRNHYLGKLSVINASIGNENTNNNDRRILTDKRNYCEVIIDSIRKICKTIGTVNFQQGMITALMGMYQNDKIVFDDKWYLYGFENNVYDVRTGEFRNYEAEDYTTDENAGYDYREPTDDEYGELLNIINQVHQDKEKLKCWASIIATGLEGKTLENFSIFNGKGGNGKSLLNELILTTHGKYGYTGSAASLCSPINKDGPNPALANLHNKRYVVFTEFQDGSRLNNTLYKQLTGGSTLNARKCHSNNTEVKLRCTVICECNKKPNLREDFTGADIRRIIDLDFPAKFTTNEKLIDPSKNIYPVNTYYKTTDFQQKYKYAMMKFMMDTYKETNGSVYIPESVQKRTLEYLTYSNWALAWFKDNYQLVENPKPIDYVNIGTTIFTELRDTDIYNNLGKIEKKQFTKSYLIGLFKNSELYKEYFLAKYEKQYKGTRMWTTNILLGFERISDDVDDEKPEAYDKNAKDPSINEQ